MAYEVQNKRCRLHLEARANSQPVKESHNCCILCDESIDWSHEGYSLIRCETKMSKNDICGHVAHINCALRSDFVGTVRGHDLEYLCKRCDKRTNLITHVEKLLDSCESIESQEDIEKLLKISADILRGSLQENALKLLYRIELATSKLRCGMDPKKIWQVQDDTSVLPSGAMPHLTNSTSLSGLEGINCQGSCERNTQGKHDQALYYMKQFSEEIDQVLRDLRKSQELEYRMAEEKLHDQKHRITTLLEQLDAEATKLARRTLSTKDSDVGALLTGITSTVNQIKQEVVKLEELKKVAQGLGKTPKSVLKEYFGMEIDD